MLNRATQAARDPGLDRTLVLLHGYGADEHDLLPLARELDPRLAVVSLQAPIALPGQGRAWFNLNHDERGLSVDPDEAAEALRLLTAELEELASGRLPPVLLGFSQGAGMALALLLTRPGLCGPVVAFSSVPPLLDPQQLAAPDTLRGRKVFLAHGIDDPLLPIRLGRATRAELGRLGLDVTWNEYEMGHFVVPEELADVRRWLEGAL